MKKVIAFSVILLTASSLLAQPEVIIVKSEQDTINLWTDLELATIGDTVKSTWKFGAKWAGRQWGTLFMQLSRDSTTFAGQLTATDDSLDLPIHYELYWDSDTPAETVKGFWNKSTRVPIKLTTITAADTLNHGYMYQSLQQPISTAAPPARRIRFLLIKGAKHAPVAGLSLTLILLMQG